MGLARSTYYDAPSVEVDEAELVTRIQAVCDEFEMYGYRRVGAGLRHQRIVVNGKKIRRLMREHHLQPRRRKRPSASLGDVHSSQPLVTVPLRLQPPVQVLKILLKRLPVFLLPHPIHPHRRVRTQTMKGTLQRRHIKQMRQ